MQTDRVVRTGNAVRELSGEVARKIAAGEVIDRPAAVIRELLDNSIDSGATLIEVETDSGGIDRIRVRDNGCGMTKDDLELCTKTHTTSKISSEDDLLTLSTLGFRGEALSSIRAVSTLEISTARSGSAWKFTEKGIVPDRLHEGTVVELRSLFANFPARRQFLKKPASEGALCRQMFTEKALAWPGITFRYTAGNNPPLVLPAAESFRERVLAAINPPENEFFFHALETSAEGFSATVIAGTPAVPRANRKNLMVFVNGRRIQEYSLVQALEYGAEGYFPNGAHPFAVLFVTMDSSLVDFNIHPAKREARFSDPSVLHHAVSSMMRNFYRNETIAGTVRSGSCDRMDARNSDPYGTQSGLFTENPEARQALSATHTRFTRDSFAVYDGRANPFSNGSALAGEPAGDKPGIHSGSGFRYLGQVLGTFLVVEKDDSLYLIDQHAAHERILYDKLKTERSAVQELLVPYRIETESRGDDAVLEKQRESLGEAGFVLESTGDGSWQVTALPSCWKGTEKDLRQDILDAQKTADSLVHHLVARSACRAACKDGDVLDPVTARDIAAKALELEEPVCPHGRPVWTILNRGELFDRVKRI